MTNNTIENIKIKRENLNNCTIKLSIEADDNIIKTAFDTALIQVRSRAQVAGFRIGKAPLNIIRENFKPQIKERALEIAVRKALTSALEKEKINPITTPLVNKIDYQENKPLKFEAELEIHPEIDPKNYENINIKKDVSKVTPEMLDKEINNICEHNARLEAENEDIAVGEKHFAIVDYKGYENGQEIKEYSVSGEMVDMAAPQTIKGLSEAIKGAKKGETKKFETEVSGKKISFEVKVNEIKKKVLPELNDEFAKQMNFENLEKLKEHISKLLEQNLKKEAEEKLVRQIEEHLVKHNSFNVPASLVEQNAESTLQRMFGQNKQVKVTEEQKKQYIEKLRPSVERDMKTGYILNAIAKKENIKVEQADMDKELQQGLERAKSEKEKKQLTDFFNSKKEHIMLALQERKVFDFLKSKAKITEA